MATYNVVKAKTATLVAATADTVNFSRPGDRLVVINKGAGDISVTYAGFGGTLTAATASGDDTLLVPASTTLVYPPSGSINIAKASLISAGTPTYCVVAAD